MISVLADGELLFARYPWIGFVLVSGIGGFIGWCIMLERGKLDAHPVRRLFVRVFLGAGVGVMSALLWQGFDGESRGLPMLMSALVAIFPLEAYRDGLKRFKLILKEAFK